jgi:hypothetical protein
MLLVHPSLRFFKETDPLVSTPCILLETPGRRLERKCVGEETRATAKLNTAREKETKSGGDKKLAELSKWALL